MEESAKNPEENKSDPDIVHAFYVIYNRKENRFGVIGSPGFFEDELRARGALSSVTEQINQYYRDQRRLDKRIITGVKTMMGKADFRNFIRGKN